MFWERRRWIHFAAVQLALRIAFVVPSSNSPGSAAVPGWLFLEDGTSEEGSQIGAATSVGGEFVFTTAMVGYVESLTDASFFGQIVIFTYPMIGNYGVPRNDTRSLIESSFESARIQAAGVIVSDCTATQPGHHLAVSSFSDWLLQNGVPGLCGIDTRALTKHLRSRGVMRGHLSTVQAPPQAFVDINSHNLVAAVSTPEPQTYGSGSIRILVLDCGMKGAIVRELVAHAGVQVDVMPWDTDLASPDLPEYHGLLVSNGPGNPEMVEGVIKSLRGALSLRRPIFCICLGHQLLALAAGADVVKLPYGNRGHNQPVKDLLTGRSYMTPQNHGYAVNASNLPEGWQPYFVNLNDGTNEGIFHEKLPMSSVQFHPEAAGGPDDTRFLLTRFVKQASEYQQLGSAFPVTADQEERSASSKGPEKTGKLEASSQDNAGLSSVVTPGSKVVLLGSGATRIGQAGEFDYAGTQAIKALKEHNVTVVLVNPNVASVQTQPGYADRTYFLPITPDFVEHVIAREQPVGILLSFGGQTALNCGLELDDSGVLAKYGVRVLGTPVDGIRATEDRDLFKQALQDLNEPFAKSVAVTTVKDAIRAAEGIGYPIILRSAFALGGLGSGFADNEEELRALASSALASSPQVLIEQSLRGWKEVEYEVVRDSAGNTMTVCNMENLDPVGIHTGESMVVAPSQTLTNQEYFLLRASAIRIIQHLGVVGECNIQFGLDPKSLQYVVIEVNPRLSRSSALASKATGYPLAYIAAKLSLGLRLDELRNAVTRKTSAFFEPALDYLVVKVPRWDFDKFPKVQRVLGSSMKSIGEAMGIGRSLCEALQKGLRMARRGVAGFEPANPPLNESSLLEELSHATDRFLPALVQAFVQGDRTVEELQRITRWDVWMLRRLQECVLRGEQLRGSSLGDVNSSTLKRVKQDGFSDAQIAARLGDGSVTAQEVRAARLRMGIQPVVKQIDTMAAEFPAFTNYLYLTYFGAVHDVQYAAHMPEDARHSMGAAGGAVMVVGSGSYHVGSSVEFDSSAVSCTRTLRSLGKSTIMVNYNPETVSTDYDESDRLYFDEISLERLLDIADLENPEGVILSMGGQIANNLVMPLHQAGLPVIGTHPTSVDRAEDRSKHSAMLDRIQVDQPRWQRFSQLEEARAFARDVGYPVLVRPSYVLSGAAMAIVRVEEELEKFLSAATHVSPEHPVVISQFWTDSREIDVDVVAHRGDLLLYAVSEHVEEAGVHSGDATMVFPSDRVGMDLQKRLKGIVGKIAAELNITGAFNIQALYRDDRLAVIETNLRASRSLPFVSKVLGVDFASVATRAIIGEPPAYEPLCDAPPSVLGRVGVKAPQFSFRRLPEADPLLGVEMRSTGEVAAFDVHRSGAYLKALMAAGLQLPPADSTVWVSLPDTLPGPTDSNWSAHLIRAARQLRAFGWRVACTPHDGKALEGDGLTPLILEVNGMSSPSLIQSFEDHRVKMVFELSGRDSYYVFRRTVIDFDIPLITNSQQFVMLVESILQQKSNLVSGTMDDSYVQSWHEYFPPDGAVRQSSGGDKAEL